MKKGWHSVILKEDLEKIVIPAISAYPKEQILNLEYRILTKDKEIKWVSDNSKLIETTQNYIKIVGAIRDITIRKNAIVALDQSKQYLDSIIDNLPIGLHIFDENGKITDEVHPDRKLALDLVKYSYSNSGFQNNRICLTMMPTFPCFRQGFVQILSNQFLSFT